MLVGMFHFRKYPDKVSRAYLYSAIAKLEEVDFFFFSSSDVDFEHKTINGQKYVGGKWERTVFPFPDFIINEVGPNTPKQIEVYNKLKKMIPFTSYSVGSKLSVYNRIKQGKEFSSYLIPYQLLNKQIDVLSFLNQYPEIILKPISGHHGNQIVSIKKDQDVFIVKSGIELKTLNRMQLYDYISQLQLNNKMLMQKYIRCRKKSGEPFDIRLHLQKDSNGEWKNTLVYPKVGSKDKVVTNLGQGGMVGLLKTFLMNEFGDEYFNIMRYLEVFAVQFATHFDTLYSHPFNELGIDVGIDEDHKIWIYEVNWRPGQIFLESKAAKLAISYMKYLDMKKQVIA